MSIRRELRPTICEISATIAAPFSRWFNDGIVLLFIKLEVSSSLFSLLFFSFLFAVCLLLS